MTKARDTGEVLNTRGTSATLDVQTSGSDFTAGRVALTEGLSHVDPRQFGFGDQGQELGLFDVNNASTGTVVNVTGTDNDAATYNWPVLGTGTNPVWWVVETYGTDFRTTQRATQCFQIGGQEGAEFVRVRHDTTWSLWFRIWSSADFPNAPVDATTTTKGLTLKNSFNSGTGVWVDNETGMKIQVFTITSTLDGDQTFTFPEAFSTECLLAGGIGLAGNLISKSTTQMVVNRLDTYSGTYSMTAIAIGY